MGYIWSVVWVAVFIAALVIEAQTAELVSIWFVPSAIISLILSLFKVDWRIQLVVFVLLSALLLILSRTVFKKRLLAKSDDSKTDLDLLIGQTAIVSEKIDNVKETGCVKIKGQIWSARMSDDSITADEGEVLIVDSISGVKLICRKNS